MSLAAALLFGAHFAHAQVKIGSNPTTIDPNANLEVEPATADRTFRVNKNSGQVTIKDGTQGEGYIFTSDAQGNAKWAPPTGTVTTGTNSEPNPLKVDAPTVNQLTLNSPITLNKGVYTLIYYAQYSYLSGTFPNGTSRQVDPTSIASIENTWPKYVYFNFIVESGSADFPTYNLFSGANKGPTVLPAISPYQVAAKIQQIVIVNSDNTVIKPKYFGLNSFGAIENASPIIAVKM